jgi:hypothetical protein
MGFALLLDVVVEGTDGVHLGRPLNRLRLGDRGPGQQKSRGSSDFGSSTARGSDVSLVPADLSAPDRCPDPGGPVGSRNPLGR